MRTSERRQALNDAEKTDLQDGGYLTQMDLQLDIILSPGGFLGIIKKPGEFSETGQIFCCPSCRQEHRKICQNQFRSFKRSLLIFVGYGRVFLSPGRCYPAWPKLARNALLIAKVLVKSGSVLAFPKTQRFFYLWLDIFCFL